MAKPKVASDWLAGCAGCHMSFLDIDERIVALTELVDLRATPITDLKEPDESGVDVGILEGGISNTYNEEVARKMRARCKILVALGDCAVFGGVPAMRNFEGAEAALKRAYIETESTDESGKIPDDPELSTPVHVRPVSDVVKVDVFLPGCAPSADAIFHILSELAQGRIPEVTGEYNDWH
ncbi:MAG TPA: NADP oxidoreductase [Anaerolineaceae bacterium]|jgi:NAD-reducing hydrogenase small subunit|nr:NADP oxidoreductase [Anaerolineaceae bacterium]HOR83785.1 NADP oxidoreductase [Anaerolineaceae bacterium]HOT52448.1 NADP oxidoreductase [Anaerolineaceae bacterium]HPL42691.1 NADP oxidoreductase [Anaerolineaceae bacterium]HPY32799.1 NADP oxidoreductase [Anaerolineaceae bacterium]